MLTDLMNHSNPNPTLLADEDILFPWCLPISSAFLTFLAVHVCLCMHVHAHTETQVQRRPGTQCHHHSPPPLPGYTYHGWVPRASFLFVCCCFIFFFFQDRVSLCCSNCLGTHSVYQAGLELTEILPMPHKCRD